MVYENNDPFGNTNWETTQITSLLKTNKGNCFSLAALYYIFSQRLQSDAYLTTAPEHIYIQHKGFDGNYYNVELTTHTFPGSGTIKTYTYTTHNAVTNGIALRRLNEKEAVALCLIYLAKGYEKKLRIENEEVKMDSFLLNCAELTLQHDSLSLNAMLLKAQVLEKMALQNEQGKSKTNHDLENILFTLNDLGYEQMPATMQANLMAEMQEPSDLSYNTPGEKSYPFSSINKSQFYYTLSKNKFQEIQQNNNLAMIDKKANQSVGENIFDPVLFALSIDPLAEKFPSKSPYNAMGNNPINMIDPDGREVKDFWTGFVVGMSKMAWSTVSAPFIETADFLSYGIMGDDDYWGSKFERAEFVYTLISNEDVRVKFENTLIESLGAYANELTGLGPEADYARGEASFIAVMAVLTINDLAMLARGEVLAETTTARLQAKLEELGACFTKNTKILTEDGYKNISEIKIGDWVWSYNEKTHEQELKIVTDAYIRHSNTIFKIYVHEEIIEATGDHPFFINGIFIKAKELHKGDSVQLYSGKKEIIDSILIKADSSYDVYNFTVDQFHTYYVGYTSILVHNSSCQRVGTSSFRGKPAIPSDPYSPESVARRRGTYENPGHHDPSGGGPNPYNPTKSVLPSNDRELWDQSILGSDGNRWTKVGEGRNAEYHRFQDDGNGNWHWNGSTDGKTASGAPREIRFEDVPSDVR